MSSALRLLSMLRLYRKGDSVENYLAREHRQNLKAIEDALNQLSKGQALYSSPGNAGEVAIATTLGNVFGFQVSGQFKAAPVFVELRGYPVSETENGFSGVSYTATSAASGMELQVIRTDAAGSAKTLELVGFRTGSASGSPTLPPSAFCWIDEPGEGSFTYTLQAGLVSATVGSFEGCRLVAYQ